MQIYFSIYVSVLNFHNVSDIHNRIANRSVTEFTQSDGRTDNIHLHVNRYRHKHGMIQWQSNVVDNILEKDLTN